MEKYLDDSFFLFFSSKTSILSRRIKTSNDDNEFRVNQHARRIFVYSLPVELIGIVIDIQILPFLLPVGPTHILYKV